MQNATISHDDLSAKSEATTKQRINRLIRIMSEVTTSNDVRVEQETASPAVSKLYQQDFD